MWAATTILGGLPVLVGVIRSVAHREAGVDVIAILAIIGCLALQEYFAGAVIALMLASGQALEDYADRRAHRELSALLARAPQEVHRYEDGDLQTRDIDEVVLGDRLFVKTGEVVPVDGVIEGDAILDESALTGESRPVERPTGDLVRSGARQRRPGVRSARDGHGRRHHVCRHRAAGGGRRAGEGARRCASPTATRCGSSRSRS